MLYEPEFDEFAYNPAAQAWFAVQATGLLDYDREYDLDRPCRKVQTPADFDVLNRQTLLRPCSPPDYLLRPAEPTADNAPETLLRAAE